MGSVLSLGPDSLYELVSTYLGTFPGVVHIIWAYVEIGITLPLSILSEYLLDDVWFPATDDVFIFDPMADWCLELHHEGQFVFAKTTIGSPSTREASTEG